SGCRRGHGPRGAGPGTGIRSGLPLIWPRPRRPGTRMGAGPSSYTHPSRAAPAPPRCESIHSILSAPDRALGYRLGVGNDEWANGPDGWRARMSDPPRWTPAPSTQGRAAAASSDPSGLSGSSESEGSCGPPGPCRCARPAAEWTAEPAAEPAPDPAPDPAAEPAAGPTADPAAESTAEPPADPLSGPPPDAPPCAPARARSTMLRSNRTKKESTAATPTRTAGKTDKRNCAASSG